MAVKDIKIYKNIMEANDGWADVNRELLKNNNCRMINLIGSPGCGKTSFLEKFCKSENNPFRQAVLEGDVETANDAERLASLDIMVSQLITKGACHLGAKFINDALADLNLEETDLVIVENVGNLVCPSEFDIGENMKIAFLSVTEGEDKPEKYPMLFRESKAVILTKTDLLPYVPFDMDRCLDYIKKINGNIPIFQISSLKDEGIEEFIKWSNETLS